MAFVTSGKLRLWVERIGDPADPAVLLIAGAESQGIGWPSVLVDRLVAGGLQVIRYDHRDTGESDSVDFDQSPYSMVDLVEDAVAVLDGLHVESAHMVGASMGGVIAQWLAATHPGRVRSLTLMSTTAPARRDLPPPDASFLARSDEIAKLPRGTDEERVEADVQVYELMNGGSLPFDEAAARDLAERHFARARDRAKSANHHRISEQRNEPPALTAIKAATLVIVAEADPIFPPAHAEALAEGIPGARTARVPGMGHTYFSPGLPEHLADQILAFIQEP
jgi:pimeloyl-ACP methyl ester carboxylesterase